MRVLLVEDDRSTARAVGRMLSGVGIEHRLTGEGEAAIELAQRYEFDAVILDLDLPDIHGYEVLRRLRHNRIAVPVLVLSGDAGTASKVSSFNFGADDYITKPFQNDEFLARLHAVVRRSMGHAEPVIRTGSMALDLGARTVAIDGRRVPLTAKEYAILELLSLRKGMTMTKEMFLMHLYGGGDEPELKIIDVFVCKLRKKLAQAGEGAANCIETVWGRGYALRDPETSPAAQVA